MIIAAVIVGILLACAIGALIIHDEPPVDPRDAEELANWLER